MNDRSSETVRHLPAGRDAHNRQLTEAYWHRQGRRQPGFSAEKPEKAPPDVTTWFGGRKESALVQRHNRQLDAIEFAEVEAEYAVRMGLRLEYVALDEASRTVTAEVDIYRGLPADSLEAAITQELLLDSVDRARRLVTEGSEQYRRKALG